MTFLFYFCLFAFFFVSLLLAAVILLQDSKSTGMGAAFGGDSSNSLFGTSTADVLKKFTAYLAGIFLITCLVLSFWTASLHRAKTSEKKPTVIEEVTHKE